MSRATLTAREAKKKRENAIKITVILVSLLVISIISIWFVLSDGFSNILANENANQPEQKGEMIEMTNDKYKDVKQNPIVTMEMTDGKVVKIELYPQIAPTTVENFVSLVKSGYYDGLTFHRLMPEFMAQGGDPKGDGTGGPGYAIAGEFSSNGFKNDLKHEVGVISMARGQVPDSAGSQFFIVTNQNSYLSLDGQYAGFGKVIEGMENVMDIVNVEKKRDAFSDELMQMIEDEGGQIITIETYTKYMAEQAEMSAPKVPPTIKTMTVETFGVEYDEPEKLAK